MSDVDQVQWRLADKILRAGLGSDVAAQMWEQLVRLRLVEPDAVCHRCINVDHHDMAPVRGGAVSARGSIDAEGGPQEIRQNLRRESPVRIFPGRAPQA